MLASAARRWSCRVMMIAGPLAAAHCQQRDHHRFCFDRSQARVGQRSGPDPRRPRRRKLYAIGCSTIHYQRQQGISLHVMARTGGPGPGGVSAFLVPASFAGVRIGAPEKKMGQQGANVCDVNFDAVRYLRIICSALRVKASRLRCGCLIKGDCTSRLCVWHF